MAGLNYIAGNQQRKEGADGLTAQRVAAISEVREEAGPTHIGRRHTEGSKIANHH